MNAEQQLHADYLYEQQLTNLKLQGKRPATIDAYSRAVRRITHHFDKAPTPFQPTILNNTLGVIPI
jgi:integrase/recombinase XerD